MHNPDANAYCRAMLQSYNITDPEEAANVATECTMECHEPCEYGRIDAKISSSLFVAPTAVGNIRYQSYFTDTVHNFSDEDIQQVIMIEMFYEMKQQRVVEKKPRMSLDEFISNIGGCLGVWSGISFLSIIQIFFYAARAIGHCISERKVKQVVQFKPEYPAVSSKTNLEYHIS